MFIPETSEAYVGHSVSLGKIVKDHAKAHDKTTGSWVLKNKDKMFVRVYTVNDSLDLRGLSLKDFLCVLEQYLFYLEKPSINKVVVATTGVLQSDEAVASLRDKLGLKAYAYLKTDEII